MSNSADPQETKGSTKASAVAGAGGGTLLVVIANTFPEDNVWRQPLILLAPSISITLNFVWLWLHKEIAERMHERKIRAFVNKTKSGLFEALKNPNISPNHRESIQKFIESIEIMVAKRDFNYLKQLLDNGIESHISEVGIEIEKLKLSDYSEPRKAAQKIVEIGQPSLTNSTGVKKTETKIINIPTPPPKEKVGLLKKIMGLFRGSAKGS